MKVYMYNRYLYSREANGRWSLVYSTPYIGPIFTSLETAKEHAEQAINRDRRELRVDGWKEGNGMHSHGWYTDADPGENGIRYHIFPLETLA